MALGKWVGWNGEIVIWRGKNAVVYQSALVIIDAIN